MAYTNPLAGKVLTVAEARLARNAMTADREFYEAWSNGDPAATSYFQQINRQCVGDPDNPQSLPDAGGRQSDGHGREVFPGSPHWRGES